ncbi:DUF4159 domain-containing protein [Bartonella tamiae]|uniref:N-terminal double-transmembrane domain-containing protein n=1 Tax=Bartonella tamiae Th239 TaxID=1094558 RepID=J1JW37_9HYPH|nr:DUF4159 domain-containing protein [Bartonella tamiae]EJF89212.1 N-terminal double-transmembrane domain-containing protein [Bartonella tamiae Th239]EJF95385.1 N-terminal double-transmembrane domain-containing protein [Bartonella tamiae Th307]
MAFGAPFLLLGLLILPAIWWLSRITPPPPQTEIFPPLRLLLKVTGRHTTPSQIPWWLLLLRLIMAALVIIALANPIYRPKAIEINNNHPLALIIDNSWASNHDWQNLIKEATILIDQAIRAQQLVYLATTADGSNQDMRPLSGEAIKNRLLTLKPQPIAPNRLVIIEKLLETVDAEKVDIAYLTDGLKTQQDQEAFEKIKQIASDSLLIYTSDISKLYGINTLKSEKDALVATIIRSDTKIDKTLNLGIYDQKNRRLGDAQTQFKQSETQSQAYFYLPLELRNDAAMIRIDHQNNAASTYLVDQRERIFRVAILSSSANEITQPLLAPLYYVIKALEGQADLITASGGVFSDDVEKLLNQNPSIFVLGDVVNMPQNTEDKLNQFIQNGGTLIRFAGNNLANASTHDHLLPVELRHGERQLGGIMSWVSPQKLAPFTQNSLFSDIPFPEDVTVSRQILAEPSPTLFDKTLLSLNDGTPLVTASTLGKGKLIFIHTAPEPSWTTLPLSGFFVEMLKKLVQFSAVYDENLQEEHVNQNSSRQPWRVLNGQGQLEMAGSHVLPLLLTDKASLPNYNHPPGFYGRENNLYALNLLDQTSKFLPLDYASFGKNSQILDYSAGDEIRLHGPLLILAALLFALDSLLILGVGRFFKKRRHILSLLIIGISISVVFPLYYPTPVHAQDLSQKDQILVQSAGKTHLAYVITGDSQIDNISKTALESLSQFVEARTTIDFGAVSGLDLDKDELAFYPLIYWPIDAKTTIPSEKAIEKINAYMLYGGTVLFDTRDQITAGLNLEGSATPNTQRLREILSGLNIPALEQTPPEHVISRSFYLMPDFPGRYRGSPLWIESSAMATRDDRPIYSGDGISSILITANDMAGAWSHDGKGSWTFPLVPDDPMQRIWAFRGGLNIIMYTLTGNYKADQVHVPALLERLDQERQK